MTASFRSTDNHDYPLFPESGRGSHLGQIAAAFKDIDKRVDGAIATKADNAALEEAKNDFNNKIQKANEEIAKKQDAATAFSGNYADLKGIPTEFTPAHHTHPISDVTNLQSELDSKLNANANAVSASKLETARNITVVGDATGTTSFDGSQDAQLSVTLANAGKTGRKLLKAEEVKDANEVLELLSVLNYKGTASAVKYLPENAKIGDVWNTTDTGMNYAWSGTEWDALGAVTTLQTLGVTATAKEIDNVIGSTSPIQDQLNANTQSIAAVKATAETNTNGLASTNSDLASTKNTVSSNTTAIAENKSTISSALSASRVKVASNANLSITESTEKVPGTDTDMKVFTVSESVTPLVEAEQRARQDLANTVVANKNEVDTELAKKLEHIPTASATALGGVIVGEGLSIADGRLSTNTVEWQAIAGKPDTFTPSAHNHVIADVDGLQSKLDALAARTYGIADIIGLQSKLDSISERTYGIADINGLQEKLDNILAKLQTIESNVNELQRQH